MKSNDFEDDPLWDLLGKLDENKPVEVSPYFARNVVREIRLAHADAGSKTTFRSLFRRLRQWRLALLGGTAVAVIALNASLTLRDSDSSLAQHPADVEVISNLDELLSYEDTSVWLDKSAY